MNAIFPYRGINATNRGINRLTRRTFRRTGRRAKYGRRNRRRKLRFRGGKKIKRYAHKIVGLASEKKVITGWNQWVCIKLDNNDAQMWYSIIGHNWPAQGTQANQRLGDKIFIRYITLHCSIAYNANSCEQNGIHFYVVHSKARPPDVTNYFDPYISKIGSAYNDTLLSRLEPNKNCVPIYKKKSVYLDPPRSTSWSSLITPADRSKVFSIKIRVMKEYEYQRVVALTEPTFNHAEYFIVAIAPYNTTWTTADPEIRYYVKMTYTDA